MVFFESISLQLPDSFQVSDSIIYQLLVIVGMIVGILVGIKKFSSMDAKREQRKSSPIQILKERYAKGEISDDEFDRMKKKLSES